MPIRAPALHLLAAASVLASTVVPIRGAANPLLPAPLPTPLVKERAAQQRASKPVLSAPAAAREAMHVERLDRAVAPAREHKVPEEEARRIREAVAAYAANDAAKARPLRDEINDPIARKLVEWFRLRAGLGEPAELRAFLAANPTWPDQAVLTQRIEEALFTSPPDAAAVKRVFAAAEPRTGMGLAALAAAYLASGEEALARSLARRAWRENILPANLEPLFLERLGRLLGEADHKWRMDRLLTDELRWVGDRDGRAAMVRRIIPLLSDAERRKAEARLAVFLRAKTAGKLMSALPAEKSADWGLAFQRVQLLRQQDNYEEAWKVLLTVPVDASRIVNPDGWWFQRRAAAYQALEKGKARLAFDLVREAGPLSPNPRNEQAFLAGWIALRRLKDASLALPYFKANEAFADGPLSKSRALYWHGRTLEAAGDKRGAEAKYRAAASYLDTFHGHLAREHLEPGSRAISLAPPAAPTREQAARFNDLDTVRAAVIAAKAGLDRSIVRAFLIQLQRHFDSEAEVGMLAHLAESMGETQAAVRIGKAGIARGLNLIYYAYPIHAFPDYTSLRAPPETALLLALARQESEFNGQTVSGAGAQGILQVMPVTARHVCRDYKIKCDLGRLIRDPGYNAMLASAYIGDRMEEVGGSYILTMTSYNAGPGRTRQWLREIGDPREASIDPVDWIFMIPFEETRDYVQKVLSNVQIYRARLGQGTGGGMGADLVRARREALPTPAP